METIHKMRRLQIMLGEQLENLKNDSMNTSIMSTLEI